MGWYCTFIFQHFFKKVLTILLFWYIIAKLSDGKQNKILAAIAQPVERILGKDEVASSNLASSSMRTPKFRLRSFLFNAGQELATSSISIARS